MFTGRVPEFSAVRKVKLRESGLVPWSSVRRLLAECEPRERPEKLTGRCYQPICEYASTYLRVRIHARNKVTEYVAALAPLNAQSLLYGSLTGSVRSPAALSGHALRVETPAAITSGGSPPAHDSRYRADGNA